MCRKGLPFSNKKQLRESLDRHWQRVALKAKTDAGLSVFR